MIGNLAMEFRQTYVFAFVRKLSLDGCCHSQLKYTTTKLGISLTYAHLTIPGCWIVEKAKGKKYGIEKRDFHGS